MINISFYSAVEHPLEGIWPSIIVSISTLITLLIMFFFISYFLYFPIKNNVKKRQEKISNEIKNASKLNSESLETSKKIDQEYYVAKNERISIISKAEKEANELKTEIISQANEKAKKLVISSKEEIANMQKNAMKDFNKKVIEMSILVSEKFLETKIDNKIEEGLITNLLIEIENEKN